MVSASMVLQKLPSRTGINTKGNFITDFCTEEEFLCGLIVSFTMESSLIIESQAKVLTSGQMEVPTKEKSKMD